MKKELIPLQKILMDEVVKSSAPCRVDCGGSWDLKAFAIPYHYINPSTVNIAINLRTKVTLKPFREGWTKVTSKGFHTEEYPSLETPFNTPLGFVFAIATYFKVAGVHIDIESESPPKSALGGSGVLGVAIINAFSKALLKTGEKALSKEEIVKLAFRIEDGLSVSLTGMQDQAIAAFGGVNKWTWRENGFERKELIAQNNLKEFELHIIIAYCGKAHSSIDINGKWVNGFITGKNRPLWFKINELTIEFADAIERHDWFAAAAIIDEETKLRLSLTPEVLIPTSQELVNLAKEKHCGSRFTGAGGGGCIWAIGEKENILLLKDSWNKYLSTIPDGMVLKCAIDYEGVV